MELRDKQALLRLLIEQGRLKLRVGHIFKSEPEPITPTWDRVEGMMIGLAVGDALGNPTEGMLPRKRWAKHGEIRDYQLTPYGVGVPSDDTQLAFWTLDCLNKDGELVLGNVAEHFATNQIFGQGHTMKRFVHNWRSGIRPWYRCSQASAGNGALMRIAPMLIPHLCNPTREFWYDTALLSVLTHMDGASVAACVAFIKMLWHLLGIDQTPEPSWWANTYLSTAQAAEADPNYQTRTAKIPYRGMVWQFVWRELQNGNMSVLEAATRWHSGAYLLETIPTVLYILSKFAHDPEQAIIRAVNDTKDNDTIAAIVGAVVGALHGKSGLPPRWIEGLSGRTRADDDGQIFEILDTAHETWY